MRSVVAPSRSVVTLASIAIAAGMAVAMLALGREPWFAGGYIKLWHGAVKSAENSQHLTDWYTFTHLIHGFGFYWVLSWVARRMSLGARFVTATLAEAAWEVFENTSFVIERYRTATISLDYYGDTVVNSLGDLVVEMAGFALAASAPVWVTIVTFVAIEVVLAFAVRDNLMLNILMLLRPIEAVKSWQSGP